MNPSPAWRPTDGSPARQLSSDERKYKSPARESPRRHAADSPARKLLYDLQHLSIENDRKLQNELDERVAEEKRRHDLQIAESRAYHERVRQSAERECELSALEADRLQKKKEAEEIAALEKARLAKLAREDEERRKERERLQREETERHRRQTEERELQESKVRLEEQTKRDAAAAEERKRKQEEEAKARAQHAADAAKARLEAAKPAPAVQAPPPKPTAPTATSTPQTATTVTITPPVATQTSVNPLHDDREQLHKRYLDLHQKLKQMRQSVVAESKKLPALKNKIGDWRREVTKSMGQLTTDKTQNRKPMGQIQAVLSESLKYTEPSIDVSQYLISQQAPSTPVLISGPFIYLINIFTKSIIRQFIQESSGGAKSADPVGVVAVSILANPAYKIASSVPLIDVLLAKYHVVCPLLFGIYGPQTTAQGRTRLGWWKEDGSWVVEQRHIERMTGLASGYAALSLRDFGKSRNENPFPNTHYWRAMAGIVNTEARNITPTHFTVLKGLVDGYVPRFIGFYGQAAVALLRVACVELPARAKGTGDKNVSQAADGVVVLREVLARDLRVTLL